MTSVILLVPIVPVALFVIALEHGSEVIQVMRLEGTHVRIGLVVLVTTMVLNFVLNILTIPSWEEIILKQPSEMILC